MTRLITVRLTPAEWNALRSCASGELESLTDADEASGIFDDLQAATLALDEGRSAYARKKQA